MALAMAAVAMSFWWGGAIDHNRVEDLWEMVEELVALRALALAWPEEAGSDGGVSSRS